MPTEINFKKLEKKRDEATQWPNKDFDWTGRDMVPENPSRASAVIVVLGTAFAFAALAGMATMEAVKETPDVARVLNVLHKPFQK